ncbi:MAG: hypothetical protein HY674_07635 [Chloroflexi bacterium]|nr:hypothetical protein [Chloroflexota bacterium]
MKTLNRFTRAAGILLIVAAPSGESKSSATKFNVLVIACEDLNTALGC